MWQKRYREDLPGFVAGRNLNVLEKMTSGVLIVN
jgi:hypothetical protein